MTAPTLILEEGDLLNPVATFQVTLPILPPVDIFLVASYTPFILPPAQNLVQPQFGPAPRPQQGYIYPRRLL